MAENDNELEFVLSAQTKMAMRAIQDMAKAWATVKQTYDQVSQMSTKATKAFKDVTLAAEHLSNTNFNKFESGMKSVANAMDSFGKTLNSDNLKSFRQNMDVTAQSVNSFYNSMKKMQNLSKVENLLDFSNLKNIDTTPLSSLVSELNKLNPTNLDSVYKAINNLAKASKEVTSMNFDIKVPNSAGSQMNAMADTLRKYVETISQFNLNGLTSFSKDISQLPKAMKTIEQINLEKAGRNIQELTNYIKSFIATLREGSSEIHDFSQIITGLGKGVNTNNLTKEVKESTKAVRDMGSETDRTNKKLGNMLSFGKIYAWYNQMRHYGRSFLNMLNQSIDFAEIENYFSRAMGNMRSQAMDFQNKLSDMFGLAQPQMMQAQATFKNMLGALGGLSDEMSYQLSERVTEMALDFSSLYNTTIDQAMTKFQAALSKQVRPIRSVSGYDITQSVLQATMQEIGLNDRKITQMNEIEKRLLVILTLQSQMAKSAAMGDFSRTIEQPANQLRILQQQLSEVGRWISAVFYGTIAKVLPYINGFVMAIKELVKTFALFLGYEMPDSGGTSGTILDGYDDAIGDINDGFATTNDELDKAKQKTKEWKNFLAGFDVAQVIPDQSNDTSDSDSGSSGTGGMTVDPRLLDALNKYKYLFDDIHMRAVDIRDELLKWKDTLFDIIKENIFEPIQTSWNKYGPSILNNAKKSFENIGHIASGIFDVVGEKWKPFFQQASDLFFSLVDTATLVSSTVTKLLKVIWDNGGDVLLEGVFDLMTAFLKLAKSVNDNFVKPFVKAINKTLVPVFGSAVGTILKLIGNLLKGLAHIIDWIAECKPLIGGLGSAFTAMFLTIKIGKILDMASALGGAHSILRSFGALALEHSGTLRKLWSIFADAKGYVGGATSVLGSFNTLLAATKFGETYGNVIFNAAVKVEQFGTKLLSTGTAAGSLAGSLMTKLGTALTWLASNPIVAVITGIGLLVGAFALFGSSQKEATYEMEDYSESLQNQIKDIESLKDSLDEARKSSHDRMDASEAEIKTLELQIETLKRMGGESGYVKDISSAEKLVEEINQKLPDTVELTKEGRLEWKKTPDEINKSIKALEKKAKVEAYSALYTEAIKTQIKAEREHAKAVDELTAKEQRQTELIARKGELEEIINKNKINADWNRSEVGQKYYTELQNINAELEPMGAEIDGLNKAVKESSDVMNAATDDANVWGDALVNSKDIMASASEALKGLNDEQRKSLSDLGDSLATTKKQLEDYSKGTIELDKKAVDSAKTTKDNLILSYAERAIGYNKSYGQMLKILEEQGIKLSDEEKKQLKDSLDQLEKGTKKEEIEFENSKKRILDNLKKSNKKMTKEDEDTYNKMFDNLKKHNVKIDNKYEDDYKMLYEMLKKHKVSVTSETAGMYYDLLGLLEQNGISMSSEQGKQYAQMLSQAIDAGEDTGVGFIKFMKEGFASEDMSTEAMQHWLTVNGIMSKTVKTPTQVTGAYEQGMNAYNTLTSWICKTFFGYVDTKGESDQGRNARSTLESWIGKTFFGYVDTTGESAAGNDAKSTLQSKLKNVPASIQTAMGGLWSAWNYAYNYMANRSLALNVGSINLARAVMVGGSAALQAVLSLRASGGFPDVGEMFIAREAGPEFVGSLGGRSAVANNYQIENGIYRAVKAAMSSVRLGGGDIHLTIQLPDGTNIEKVIKDYNDYVKRNGGNGGFIV